MVYKFFDKKNASLTDKSAAGSGVKSMSQNKRPLDLAMQQLPEELHKSVIRKFKRRKVYSTFKDNIWGADLSRYATNKQI